MALFPVSSFCQGVAQSQVINELIRPGACFPDEYLPPLSGRRVAVTGNQTSRLGNRLLVDTLLSLGVNIVKVFGPEHGFRGNAADGSLIGNTIDSATGIPVVSLYGQHRKPLPEDMTGIDIMVFDIQDVGCRFYTYISTLTYVMESCAQAQIPLLILDRPNPNGYYVDGPVLKPEFSSFVGLHPVPVVYGMTLGEYAMMVNGEGWLGNGLKCDLRVIPCRGYTHESRYELPVKPSPNLPNQKSIILYPSLCLFEGTVVSVGRGTEFPFQVIGHPGYYIGSFIFRPVSIPGISENPPFRDQQCLGINLVSAAERVSGKRQLELFWILNFYKTLNLGEAFFNANFDKLAGNSELREQITAGISEEKIRESWKTDLSNFLRIRSKYLLYPDFKSR